MSAPAKPLPSRRSTWLLGAAGLLGGGLLLSSSMAVVESCVLGSATACALPPHTVGWAALSAAGLVLIAIGAFSLGRVSIDPNSARVAGVETDADAVRATVGED